MLNTTAALSPSPLIIGGAPVVPTFASLPIIGENGSNETATSRFIQEAIEKHTSQESSNQLARLSLRDINQNELGKQNLLLPHHWKDVGGSGDGMEMMQMSKSPEGFYIINNITLKVSRRVF
jgi:hypothetical protein